MADNSPGDTAANAHIERIRALFDTTPSSLMAIVVGVTLVFLLLWSPVNAPLLKPWAALMMSTAALRGCLWLLFRASHLDLNSARRWEWGYALAMCTTGITWGLLSGPLYPTDPVEQVFILVLTIITAFSGAIYAAASRLAFVLFAIPTVVPSLLQYVLSQAEIYFMPGIIATAGCIIVLMNVHHALYRFANKQLRHSAETEALLAEQEALFQTVTAGIAIVRNGIAIKCNTRLGEILGRSLKDIQSIAMTEMLVSADDADTLRAAAQATLMDGKPFHAQLRMRRGNGSEFYADISGRRRSNDHRGDVTWLISEIDTGKD